MRKSIDKRNFERIKLSKFFVEFKVQGSDVKYNVELLDLSAGGMAFLRNSIINKNDVLTIKFPFRVKVLLTGKVVRIEGREVGIQFTSNEDDITKFVEAFNDEYPYLVKNSGKGNEKLSLTGQGIDHHQDDDIEGVLNIDKD